MKLLGFYGHTDVGKTALIEALTKKKTSKYKLEIKRGITLKVGYADYQSEKNEQIYILDNPGHESISPEALRNIDLLDLAIYVIDSTVINDEPKLNRTWAHYKNFRKIFEFFNLPHILILNKIDLCDKEMLLKLYAQFKEGPAFCYAASTFLENSILDLRAFLDNYTHTLINKVVKKEILGRVIKSFDINKVGYTSAVKGGILGVYLFNKLDLTDRFFLTDKYSKKFEQVLIKKGIPNLDSLKIVTLETMTEPFLYKNDLKKGSFLFTNDTKDKVLLLTSPTFKFKQQPTNLKKGDRVLIICEGQSFYANLRRVQKKIIQVNICKNGLYPYFLKDSKAIIYRINQNSSAIEALIGCADHFLEPIN